MAAKYTGDSSLLNESLELLLKTLDDIEKKNVHLQKLCCARRNLFKPWPRKRNGDSETVEKERDDVQASGQSEDHLTASEKSEIAMLDKMLNKAQTAREVQQKIKESGRTRKPKLLDTKGDHSSKDPVKVSHEKNVQNDRTTTKPSVNNVVKKSTNDRLTHNLEKGTKSPSQGDQVAPKSSTTRQGQVQYGRFSGRGSSSASMRGGKKVVAAHLSAPFQTNPRLSMPKRQVDKRISSGAKCRTVIPGQSKSSVQTQRSSVLKQKPNVHQEQTAKDNPRLENQLENDDKVPEMIDTLVDDSGDDKVTSEHNSSIESNHSRGPGEGGTHLVEEKVPVENFGNLKLAEDTETQEKEKRFCLQTDGKKLSIPGKLRRLYANNVRLREKVKLQRMTQKVDVCTSRQEFVSKVESTFEWHEAQQVVRKVNTITNIYTNLLRLLHDLDLRDPDTWPCYDVLRAKRMVEFILTVFYKTEEERLKFNPDVLSTISREGRPLQVKVKPPQGSSTSQFWSPAFIKQDPCVHKALSKPHDCLQYKSSRDLERYMTLVFQIQYEQLQLRLLDTIATEALPLLKSGNYKSSEIVWMFRSLYSMLTSNKSFPVIVKDTIQDLEESMDI